MNRYPWMLSIRSIFGGAVILTLTASLAAQTRETLPLWPHGAPDDHPLAATEADATTPKDALVAGRRVIRLGQVSSPTLTVYRPSTASSADTAVLVFPGGGYSILALDLEGSEVCEWLNTLGITAFLVKYRVPAQPTSPRKQAPLQDAQRAMSLVRRNAAKWGVGPKRIGVIGFSAGGHLAATLSTHFEQRSYTPMDEADSVSIRPDFAMLVYPAYLVGQNSNELSADLTVSPSTPKTFLIQAEDDGVRVENSLVYYNALRKAHVPAEMHIYSEGGHGYGLRRTPQSVTTWPLRAAEWLRNSGLL